MGRGGGGGGGCATIGLTVGHEMVLLLGGTCVLGGGGRIKGWRSPTVSS